MLTRVKQALLTERAFKVLPWTGVVITALWAGLLIFSLTFRLPRWLAIIDALCLALAAGTTGIWFGVSRAYRGRIRHG